MVIFKTHNAHQPKGSIIKADKGKIDDLLCLT